MKHTKDNIEFTITKKDTIYLSIILCLVCVVSAVCILIPRYYQLHTTNSTPPSQNTTQTGGGTTNFGNSPAVDDYTTINQAYANLYSTKVLNILKNLSMPYSSFSRFLDSAGNLNVSGYSINFSTLENLEDLATPIYNSFDGYSQANQTISSTLINSNDLLHSQIIAFTNKLIDIENNK